MDKVPADRGDKQFEEPFRLLGRIAAFFYFSGGRTFIEECCRLIMLDVALE
jgi:hypothetical protein